jgi:hypothetical protein
VIETILIGFMVIAIPATLWFGICNERTFRVRREIIDSVDSFGTDWDARRRFWEVFERTSYNSHLWRAFCFRNPVYAYGDMVRAAYFSRRPA